MQTMKQIEARNRRFRKMTKAQKRVAVAKDALAMIESGKIRAKHGTYRTVPTDKPIVADLDANATETQATLLAGKFQKCECCALGCLLIASVRQGDGMDAATLENTWEPHYSKPLSRLYSFAQLRDIEEAFEDKNYCRSGANARSHIIGVFKNIIANEGRFVPA